MTTSVVLPRKLPDSSRMFGNFSKPDLAKLMLSFYKFIYDPGPFLPPSQNSEKYMARTRGHARAALELPSCCFSTQALCFGAVQLCGSKCCVVVGWAEPGRLS